MLKLKNIKTLAKRLLELFRFAKYLRKCIIYELIERDRRPLAKCGSRVQIQQAGSQISHLVGIVIGSLTLPRTGIALRTRLIERQHEEQAD
jgi:hypothetical protein